jgi:hypothetical protein
MLPFVAQLIFSQGSFSLGPMALPIQASTSRTTRYIPSVPLSCSSATYDAASIVSLPPAPSSALHVATTSSVSLSAPTQPTHAIRVDLSNSHILHMDPADELPDDEVTEEPQGYTTTSILSLNPLQLLFQGAPWWSPLPNHPTHGITHGRTRPLMTVTATGLSSAPPATNSIFHKPHENMTLPWVLFAIDFLFGVVMPVTVRLIYSRMAALELEKSGSSDAS